MKNITNINIKDLTNNYNISLQGTTQNVPVKNGYTEKRTVSGKTRILSINVSQNITVNIEKINEVEYLKLLRTWTNGNTIILRTELNKSIRGLIVGSDLVLSNEEDLEGNIFYFGTLEVRE